MTKEEIKHILKLHYKHSREVLKEHWEIHKVKTDEGTPYIDPAPEGWYEERLAELIFEDLENEKNGRE